MTDKTIPPFTLDKSRYDQSYFAGRSLEFYDSTDPRMLLNSDEDIQKATDKLNNFKNSGKTENITDEELWMAKKVKDSCIHP